MTDRVHSITVVLEKDMRRDDAEGLVNAILHMRGVLSVGTNIADPEYWIAEQRARTGLQVKIRDILWPELAVKPQVKRGD